MANLNRFGTRLDRLSRRKFLGGTGAAVMVGLPRLVTHHPTFCIIRGTEAQADGRAVGIILLRKFFFPGESISDYRSGAATQRGRDECCR